MRDFPNIQYADSVKDETAVIHNPDSGVRGVCLISIWANYPFIRLSFSLQYDIRPLDVSTLFLDHHQYPISRFPEAVRPQHQHGFLYCTILSYSFSHSIGPYPQSVEKKQVISSKDYLKMVCSITGAGPRRLISTQC